MRRSAERILCTHVGSLPRQRQLSDLLIDAENGAQVDTDQLRELAAAGVAECVEQQLAAGIDIINDGEQPRVGFQTYVAQRLEGFDGASERDPFQDFAAHPDFAALWTNRGMVVSKVFDAAMAQNEVKYKDLGPAINECDLFDEALANASSAPTECFMTAASPGIVCTTLRNNFYETHEAYVRAVAREMAKEYELIHSRGYLLQLDCPDLAMERHGMFQNHTIKEFQAAVALHVEAINDAVRNIPAERIRLHICWGNYDGPHDYDVALEDILPIINDANVGAYSIEFANPRHQHEYAALKKYPLKDDALLIPGIIDSTVNYIEHPEVVCNRILEAVEAIGERERIIAGVDCGFGTFAGWEMVAPSVMWAKFAALNAGAELASQKLWR